MKRIAHFALPIQALAILFLIVTGNFFSSSPFVIAAQVLALALMIWARRSFHAGQFSTNAEQKKKLMSNGPYRFIRHPMYAASLLLKLVKHRHLSRSQ
ncbi:MAG: isoprenylcysteine carboxylmethyltransferase family protein [Anaerolineales bacterium]